MLRVRMLEDREYEGTWEIEGKRVNPPCAYACRDHWLSHIAGLHSKYKKAVDYIKQTPRTSTLYPHLEDHLYYKLLDHLDANYARR